MNTKRVSIFAGTILSGALLLGTAGLVFAQGPMTSPSPSATSGMSGMSGGMMSDQGQMRGQIQRMMSGQIQRMMSGQGLGTMGAGMGAGQMPDMTAMHAAMGQDSTWDLKLMQSMHQQYQSTR